MSVAAPPAAATGPSAPSRPRRSLFARVLRVVGLLCLASALGLGGYLAWLFWGTGLQTSRAQGDLRPALEAAVEAPQPPPDEPAEIEQARIRLPGTAVAILQVPRIGLDMVVVEGTTTEDLKKGPGHYSGTALPWEDRGRVGIAGHRTTYGRPFWSIDRLKDGDRILLLTEFGTYEYRVTGIRVITPRESWVLRQTKRPTLVLTTCEPRFSASHRLVVFATREAPRAPHEASG